MYWTVVRFYTISQSLVFIITQCTLFVQAFFPFFSICLLVHDDDTLASWLFFSLFLLRLLLFTLKVWNLYAICWIRYLFTSTSCTPMCEKCLDNRTWLYPEVVMNEISVQNKASIVSKNRRKHKQWAWVRWKLTVSESLLVSQELQLESPRKCYCCWSIKCENIYFFSWRILVAAVVDLYQTSCFLLQ